VAISKKTVTCGRKRTCKNTLEFTHDMDAHPIAKFNTPDFLIEFRLLISVRNVTYTWNNLNYERTI
jgi:hypothetical protein